MTMRILTSLVFILVLTQTANGMEEDQRKEKRKQIEQPILRPDVAPEGRPEDAQQDKKPRQDREPQPDDIVTLRGCDSEDNIYVTRKLACLSITISNLLEDADIFTPIQLPNVTKKQLETFIIPAWKEIERIQQSYVDKEQREATDAEIKGELIKFLTTLPTDDKKTTCAQIIMIANYLDSGLIFEAACEMCVTLIDDAQNSLQDVQALQKILNDHKINNPIQDIITTRYLKNRGCYCLDKTLEGHAETVQYVTITPDSKHLISGSYDDTIKIWDISTGTCIKTLGGHRYGVNSVTITPDGKDLISGSRDKTIKIWDIAISTCIKTLEGHGSSVFSVTVTPDCKHLISGSFDNTIKIWDIATGTCIKTLEGHTNVIWSVIITPDGKHIISGSSDKTIKIWDIATGTCIKTLGGHRYGVNSVTITPDGKHLISGSSDKTIKIWNIVTNTCIKTLEGHTNVTWNEIWSVIITPDGKHIISGSEDKTIKIWSIPLLNSSCKTSIIQAWLVAQIMKDPNCIIKILRQNSEEEEKVWKDLPENTRNKLCDLLEKK